MAKNIFQWADTNNSIHFADHSPSGQAVLKGSNGSNGVVLSDAVNTTKAVKLNQGYVTSTAQAINTQNINFNNKNSLHLSPTGWFIFIILICIIHILKTDKKNHHPTNERFKYNPNPTGLSKKLSFSSTPEDAKTEKGLSGELIVSRMLSSNFDRVDYLLINGVTLPTYGGTTQIDHVVVSKYGIFVIETKNMSGWIYGSFRQSLWTQTLSYGKEKFRFQNPIHQNNKHTKTLQSKLGINAGKFFPLVVFVGDSQFKTDMPENVLSKDSFVGFIKNKSTILFNDDEVIAIKDRIKEIKLRPTAKNHSDHIEHVNTIVNQRQQSTQFYR